MTELNYSHSPESESAQSFADPGIPALQAVLDPRELGRYLHPILPPHWGVLRDIQIDVLRHHRGKRCTVEITLQTTTSKHELIGKVYARDRSEVHRGMKRISESGFGPGAEFSIPQPLAYLLSVRLLVYEKVQGLRAKDIFEANNEQSRAMAAERCALWLARFHATELQSERIITLSDQLILLEQRTERLARLAPPLEDKARRLYKQLEGTKSALNDVEPRAGHGSFSPSHVILAKASTVTIDWDRYNVADPARDVGRFIIELRRLAYSRFGSIRAFDAVAEVFRQTYLAVSKLNEAVQLPYYEAAACLQIAGRLVKDQSDRYKKLETLLDEGLRILRGACLAIIFFLQDMDIGSSFELLS
jgi:hypothetical protein